MTLHESHRPKMERLIAAIRPDFKVPPNARFVIEDEKQFPSSNPRYLFHNGLQVITPLTWLIFIFNLMGYFFLISWTPTILVSAAKASQTVAALTGAGLQVGGTIGALVLCWWLQRQRFLAIAILFLIAVPVVAAIGYAGIVVDGRAGVCGLPGRRRGARHSVGDQRRRGDDLSDIAARQRIWLAAWAGPPRRHHRTAGRHDAGRRLPYPAPLPVRGDSVRARRSRDFIIYVLNNARLKAHPELAQGQ